MSRELFVLIGTLMVVGLAAVVGLYSARARGIDIGQRELGIVAILIVVGVLAALAAVYLPASGFLGSLAIGVVVLWFAGRAYWARSGGPPLMSRDIATPMLVGLIAIVGVLLAMAILTR